MIYLNGRLEATKVSTRSMSADAAVLGVAWDGHQSDCHFNGGMDEVAGYGTALFETRPLASRIGTQGSQAGRWVDLTRL